MKFVFSGLIALLLIIPMSASMQVASKKLDVPYASQAPAGNCVQPWKDTCEETSILIVERFYQQASTP